MPDEANDKGSAGGSPFEGLNKTVVLGGVAVLGAAGIALAYFFSWVSDQLVGLLIAGAFAIILALFTLKVAFDVAKPALRNGLVAYVLAFAAVALFPAKDALHLGHASASATLSETNKTLVLPSGGSYRVMVSGHLSEGRDARITYRLKSGEEIVDGALERQYMTRRARRGPGIQVPEDHDLEAQEMTVSGNPPSIELDSVSGGHELLVQAFSTVPPYFIWAAMALVLLAGMFLEVKAPANGAVAMTGAMAVCFGLVIKTANPASMAWASLWGALLAAMGGALGGSVLGAIGRKIFAAPEAPGGRKGKKKKDDDDEDDEKPRAKAKDKPAKTA